MSSDCHNQIGLPCERARRCELKKSDACRNFAISHGRENSCKNCAKNNTDRCRFVCMIQVRAKQRIIEEGLNIINGRTKQ